MSRRRAGGGRWWPPSVATFAVGAPGVDRGRQVSGERVTRRHLAIPDITRKHWSVNIRKFVLSANSLDELPEPGHLTPCAAGFLEGAVAAGLTSSCPAARRRVRRQYVKTPAE